MNVTDNAALVQAPDGGGPLPGTPDTPGPTVASGAAPLPAGTAPRPDAPEPSANASVDNPPASSPAPGTATPSAGGSDNAIPPTSTPAPQLTLAAHIKRVFGDGTAFELLALTDPRLDPATAQTWKSADGNLESVVAIACGMPSQGLCALIVPSRPAADQFLKANPGLADTFVTAAGNVHCIWMRLSGWYPDNVSCGGMEWVSTGLVLVPDLTARYSPTATVVSTTFASLRWPPELDLQFFEAKTVSEFGPFFLGSERSKKINLATFARVIAHAAGLKFDTETETFSQQKPNEKFPEMVTTAFVTDLVAQSLTRVAAADPDFPARELRLPRVRALVAHMKLAVAFTRTDANDSLVQYLRTWICPMPGGTLTVRELFEDYMMFCRGGGKAALPESEFRVKATKYIRELFGVAKRHDVMRAHSMHDRDTARYGFSNLGFKVSLPEQTEVPERPERPEQARDAALKP